MVELPNGMSSPPLTVMNWVDGANFTSSVPQVDQRREGFSSGSVYPVHPSATR